MGSEIPLTGAAVVALATGGIVSIAFRSGVLARRANAHRYRMYLAPNDFTNSGQQGDLSLIDFSQYSLGLRRDVALDRSNAPGWTRDVVSYRVILRADGQPRWDKAQIPKNGDSRSWAVTLGARL